MDGQMMSSSQILGAPCGLPISMFLYVCLYVCPVMRAAATSDSTSTDSAGLTQSSTIEEQAQTPSPQCPPLTCKSAAVHLIRLSALTFLAFSCHTRQQYFKTKIKQATQDIMAVKQRHMNRNISSSSHHRRLYHFQPYCAAIYWRSNITTVYRFPSVLYLYPTSSTHYFIYCKVMYITLFYRDDCIYLQLVPCRRLLAAPVFL